MTDLARLTRPELEAEVERLRALVVEHAPGTTYTWALDDGGFVDLLKDGHYACPLARPGDPNYDGLRAVLDPTKEHGYQGDPALTYDGPGITPEQALEAVMGRKLLQHNLWGEVRAVGVTSTGLEVITEQGSRRDVYFDDLAVIR